MTKDQLKEILTLHTQWLDDSTTGKRADLGGADLFGTDFRGADLSGADLHYAYLNRACLSGANLRDADLRCADLSGADLSDADLHNVGLSVANLRGADLSGAYLRGVSGLPLPCPGLAKKVLDQIETHPETHDQGVWHSDCGTRHCCAGWACILAGYDGGLAEARLGTKNAAMFLLGGTGHPFGPYDDPIPWLRQRIEDEKQEAGQ